MSAYADQIISVVKEVKNDIFSRLDNDEVVTVDQVNQITRDIFKKCAKQFGVTENTVADKCTRKMKISTSEFYDLVKRYMLTEDTTLEERVVMNMPDGESESYVRRALQAARDN